MPFSLEVALTKRGGQFIDAISCSAMEPPRLTIVALRCYIPIRTGRQEDNGLGYRSGAVTMLIEAALLDGTPVNFVLVLV